MVKIKQFLIDNIIALLLLSALVGTSIVFIKISLNNISYPYSVLAGLEDENLARSIMVLKGQSLYPPLTDYPFVVTLYPPVFYYFSAIFVKFFGETIIAGRIFTFSCSILVCILSFLITRHYTRKTLWSLIPPALFILSGYLQTWGQMFKNDIVGVFFGFLGIYLFLAFKKKGYLYSIPVLLLAVFTKQTFITAPLAVVFYLLFTKNAEEKKKRKFIKYFFLLFGLIFLLENILTGGQFFIDTIMVPRIIPWQFSLFQSYWVGVFKSYGSLLILSLVYLFYEKAVKKEISLISWFFLLSCLARYDIGIEGSSINYFMETIAITAILGTISLHEFFFINMDKLPSSQKIWTKSAFLLFLFLVVWLLSKQTPLLSEKLYLAMFGTIAFFWIMGYWIKRIFAVDFVRGITSTLLLQIIIFSTSTAFLLYRYGEVVKDKLLYFSFLGIFSSYFARFVSRKIPFIFTLVALIIQISSTALLIKEVEPKIISVFNKPLVNASNLSPYQKKVDDLIKKTPGRVLIDSESYLAIKNHRDFEYIPIGLKLRRLAGFWDYKNSKFYKDIGEQKFRFFIKSQGWTDPELMYKIYQHYVLTKNIDTGVFFYEVFEPAPNTYQKAVSLMRKKLDEIEAKFPSNTILAVQKIDKQFYLVGLAYENDTVYGSTFNSIISYPKFRGLYRPLHSNNPNSSVILFAEGRGEIEAFAKEIFGKKGYIYRLLWEEDKL